MECEKLKAKVLLLPQRRLYSRVRLGELLPALPLQLLEVLLVLCLLEGRLLRHLRHARLFVGRRGDEDEGRGEERREEKREDEKGRMEGRGDEEGEENEV